MSLRSWLRKQPQPDRIRIRTVDDEERIIELSEDARGKWKAAEESILAANAITVELLGPTGKDGQPRILRAQRLEYDDDDDGPSTQEREEKLANKIVATERRELAGVLDSYGKRLTEAYKAGSEASLGATDQLTALVATLTEQTTGFILNISNLAKTVGELLQESGDGPKKSSDGVMDKLASVAMMKMIGFDPQAMMAAAAAQQAQTAKKNGKKERDG
jgi:hypothetical protein